MKRKLLLAVFTNEACKRNHAFMYAIDLAQHGHTVSLIIEGEGTQSLLARQGRFGELFEKARELGLIAGLCRTASSSGCGDASLSVSRLAEEAGLPLLDSLDGHAGIAPFVEEGYELVVF